MSPSRALILLLLVALCWGINYPVGKLLLDYMPPLWVVCLRSIVATAALLVLCLASGRLVLPKRADMPVVLSTAILQMMVFSALVSAGLQFVAAGRSAVLAYTTPIWVLPGAWLLLGERPTWQRTAGAAIAMLGLVTMFGPWAVPWSDKNALIGNGLILLAAFFWSLNIIYIRAHKWVTPPFELTFWQALLASILLLPVTVWLEGVPALSFSPRLWGLLLYGGVFGIAIAYWIMTTVNKALPSSFTSLASLLVPVFGLVSSWVMLSERPDWPLIGSAVLIVAGVAVGAFTRKSVADRP